MSISTLFQSFTRSSSKKEAPVKVDEKKNDQLFKAIAQYNLEIQVAETVSYMTAELLKSRLSYMRDHTASYTQAILKEVEQQRNNIAELEQSFTSFNLTADEQTKEAEILFAKIENEKKTLKELELELQASKAFYINTDLIRARILDMKNGTSYKDIVENEKESWLEMHQAFNNKPFLYTLL